ncbi:MAG: tetratricopeptide repeat protein [Synechococcales bacterium]|nr:tetratricopeptide repeat protein [Synechococcales bacterium]
MTSRLAFTAADDGQYASLTPEQRRQRLSQSHLTATERATLLYWEARYWISQGEFWRAGQSLNDSLRLQPDSAGGHAYRGVVLDALGQYGEAIAAYDRALTHLPDGQSFNAAQIWYCRGNALRSLERRKDALASYERAIALAPDYADALSGRGTVLALVGRRQDGLKDCDRALQIQPNDPVLLNNQGIVLLIAGRLRQALGQFEAATDQQPDFNKAWNNHGITLMRLGREREAIASLERALRIKTPCPEPWHATSWSLLAFLFLKTGQFERAIASSEQAQVFDPDSYPAALYKIAGQLASGQVLSRLRIAAGRQQLYRDLGTILHFLRFRLLVLVGMIGLLVGIQGDWAAGLRQILPTVLSIGIIALIAGDLWRNKTKLSLVWRTYFCSGLFTYLRALGIIVVTFTTFTVANRYAPAFMHWGWANLVFGQPGNIIFQPLNLLEDLSHALPQAGDLLAQAESLVGLFGMTLLAGLAGGVAIALPTAIRANVIILLILGFWALLLLGIPFWARLEERIFRQGAHTWGKICLRSTQFGLIHLVAGIPILAGFVLIVPGFLFACRYKYVHDRHLAHHHDPLRAQEAGVDASTADHAVYNAILVSAVTLTLLLG